MPYPLPLGGYANAQSHYAPARSAPFRSLREEWRVSRRASRDRDLPAFFSQHASAVHSTTQSGQALRAIALPLRPLGAGGMEWERRSHL